jgi:hypothetical protein
MELKFKFYKQAPISCRLLLMEIVALFGKFSCSYGENPILCVYHSCSLYSIEFRIKEEIGKDARSYGSWWTNISPE